MPRRKIRLDRKLHRRYLDLGVVDACLDSNWRRKFLNAVDYELHAISANDCPSLPTSVAYGIRRFQLSYTVSKVPQNATPFSEPDWEGHVFVRFAARRYDDIVRFCAINPDVL